MFKINNNYILIELFNSNLKVSNAATGRLGKLKISSAKFFWYYSWDDGTKESYVNGTVNVQINSSIFVLKVR